MVVTASTCRTETVFDYNWKDVVVAYWSRYPNPYSTHVLTEDTISREVRDGKLRSRRLLSKTNPVPRWGARFYNNVPVKIVEDSVLDPVKKTLTTYTRNLGMKKIMNVEEIVVYSEQPDGSTLAERRAFVSSQVLGFSRAIRAFGLERFKSNGVKAFNGFNHVLQRMFPHSRLGGQHHQPALAAPSELSVATSTTATSTVSSHSSSTTDRLKGATKVGYEFFKSHASKIAQLFSVKN